MPAMEVLLLSDIHGNTDALERILWQEDDHDAVIVLGDLTDTSFSDPVGVAQDVIDLLNQHGSFVKAVPGNMDGDAVQRLLADNRVNLHKQLASIGDYDLVGFGGGSTPVDTPFEPSDDERGQVLDALLERTKAPHRCIISHMPPHGTSIDRTSDGTQAGSTALRQLIEDNDIDLVCSGHIHEARGTDQLGDTLLVNPGPVNNQHYARLTLGDDVHVDLR